MSSPVPERAIVDAGLKALSVDSGMPKVVGHAGASFVRAADEHGRIEIAAGAPPVAELDRLGFARAETAVLCPVHGLPESIVRRGDPYREEVGRAFAGLRQRLGGWTVELGFQSKFGPGRRLQPYTDAVIRRLAGAGVRNLLMVPLGFVAENLETFYDMDAVFGPRALREGITQFARLACPNTDPDFLDVLAGRVREHLAND